MQKRCKERSDLQLAKPKYFILDDHIDPRRYAFFMARLVLRDIQNGVLPC